MTVMTPIDLASGDSAGQQCPAVAFELRELRAFLSVARTGNFGRAARDLQLSQPALSNQVQRLEAVVGQPLLLRHGRGATLTPAGTALFERLDVVSQLLDAPLAWPGGRRAADASLSLGLPPELAPMLLPALVAALHDEWPQLRLAIRETSSAALEEAVLGHRTDVAILQDPPALDGLDFQAALKEPLGLVVGPRSRFAQDSRALRLRELADIPLILPDERHWIHRKLASATFQYGVVLSPRLQVGSLAALKAMAGKGLGGTVLPRAAVRDELARGSLVFRPIGPPALVCVHAVAMRKAAEPAARALGALTRRVIGDLVADGSWPDAALCGPDQAAGAEAPDMPAPAGADALGAGIGQRERRAMAS